MLQRSGQRSIGTVAFGHGMSPPGLAIDSIAFGHIRPGLGRHELKWRDIRSEVDFAASCEPLPKHVPTRARIQEALRRLAPSVGRQVQGDSLA